MLWCLLLLKMTLNVFSWAFVQLNSHIRPLLQLVIGFQVQGRSQHGKKTQRYVLFCRHDLSRPMTVCLSLHAYNGEFLHGYEDAIHRYYLKKSILGFYAYRWRIRFEASGDPLYLRYRKSIDPDTLFGHILSDKICGSQFNICTINLYVIHSLIYVTSYLHRTK